MSFIKGKILRITNEYTVVIDVGKEEGVTLGTKFLIYGNAGDLADPDTKKNLGVLEIPKGEVVVKLVQEKYSVAETEFESQKTSIGQLLSISLITRESHKLLPVETKDIKPVPEEIFTVRVGDLVRTIQDTEE